jgi:hypothetical protein
MKRTRTPARDRAARDPRVEHEAAGDRPALGGRRERRVVVDPQVAPEPPKLERRVAGAEPS